MRPSVTLAEADQGDKSTTDKFYVRQTSKATSEFMHKKVPFTKLREKALIIKE